MKIIAKQSYYRQLLKEYKTDIIKTWNVINNLVGRSNDKSSISETLQINNKDTTDPKQISEGFCDYFSNVGSDFANKIPSARFKYDHYLRNKNANISMFMAQLMKMKC